jgi:hypothetical protein
MRFYCLALILILISMASAQAQEFNASNNTNINDSPRIASAQPQEINKTSATSRTNELLDLAVAFGDVFDLNVSVLEIDDETKARFGVGKMETAKHDMYKISIKNKGDIRISDVIVNATMDKGMKFESTRYYEENLGRLDVVRAPCDFRKETKTDLTWNIGTLEPEETKTILLEAYIKPNVDKANVTVNVNGYAGGDIPVGASKDKAFVTDCEYLDKITGKSCKEASDTCEVVYCPTWSIPQ